MNSERSNLLNSCKNCNFLKTAKAHLKKPKNKYQNQTHNVCADNQISLSYVRKLPCFPQLLF